MESWIRKNAYEQPATTVQQQLTQLNRYALIRRLRSGAVTPCTEVQLFKTLKERRR